MLSPPPPRNRRLAHNHEVDTRPTSPACTNPHILSPTPASKHRARSHSPLQPPPSQSSTDLVGTHRKRSNRETLGRMFRTRELIESGLSRREIQLARQGLSRLTWGTYVEPGLTEWQAYDLQCRAVISRLGPEATLAGPSAAAAWGLPMDEVPDKIYVRNIGGGAYAKEIVRLPEGPAVQHEGRLVTPLDRTAADCCRFLSARDSLIVADAALQSALCTADDFDRVLSGLRNTKHISRVRWIFENADGRAESPGESWARMLAISLGYEVVPQYHVVHESGEAYLDLLLVDGRTAIEFDGATKYKRYGAPKIMKEKLRKGDLEAIGYRLLEFVWQKMDDKRQFVNRLTYAGVKPTRRPRPIKW